MNKSKLKKTAALVALTIAYLFAVFSCNGFLLGYVLAQHHNRLTPSVISAEPAIRVICAVLEFPLVHLAKLLPYQPGSASGRIVAFTILFSYIFNSILWSIVTYSLFRLAIKRR